MVSSTYLLFVRVILTLVGIEIRGKVKVRHSNGQWLTIATPQLQSIVLTDDTGYEADVDE